MPRSPHPRRSALTLISVAMLGLALVLGLWQHVDRSCTDGERDPAAPLATCDPAPLAEVEQAPMRLTDGADEPDPTAG